MIKAYITPVAFESDSCYLERLFGASGGSGGPLETWQLLEDLHKSHLRRSLELTGAKVVLTGSGAAAAWLYGQLMAV